MALSVALDLDRVWTPEDVWAVPELGGRRVEIVDGMLVVSPQAGKPHLFTVDRLVAMLTAAAPSSLHVTGSAAEVQFGRTYRVPDAAVLTVESIGSQASGFQPRDVVLAVEVESQSSITTDRITKPAQYAAGGIPHYWRVETDPLRLVTYALDGETYVQTG